jgi:outer membrane immunogenic protein
MQCGRVKVASQRICKATGVHVKKLLVASVVIAAAALSAPARAADMQPYAVARVPIAVGYDWEGFYVGGHIGGASDHVNFTQTNVGWSGLFNYSMGPLPDSNVNTGESGSLGAASVTGGLQIGYNWLLPGPYLFGLEADISGAGISSSTETSPPGDPLAVAQWSDKLDLYGSVRARLGWVSGNWLFYGTGGFGWAYDKFTRSQLTAPILDTLNSYNAPFIDTKALQAGTVVTNSHVRPGWVAGAGVEWAFARTWTVKLEYLHFDTASEILSGGHFNYLPPLPPVPPGSKLNQFSSSVAASQGDLTIDTVRIGINHNFN